MSVEELVKELRIYADCDARSGEPLGTRMRKAADKLEELAAENERLEREAEAHYDAGHYRAMSEHATPQRIRADKAETALAEAQRENEALQKKYETLKQAYDRERRRPVQILGSNAGGKNAE